MTNKPTDKCREEKSIESPEGQSMLLTAGKAFYWDKLIEKIGLGVAIDIINGDRDVNL